MTSRHKRTIMLLIIFIGLFAFGLGSLAFRGFNATKGDDECVITLPDTNRYDEYKQGDVGRCIEIETVMGHRDQSIGLSKYEKIPDDFGMLFLFEDPSPACFWMKDMNFDIDIIWLNTDQKIVKIEPNVKPESYPNSFCSPEPASYVIELNSGVSKQAGLSVGQMLNLNR